jgi:hypothetical protein
MLQNRTPFGQPEKGDPRGGFSRFQIFGAARDNLVEFLIEPPNFFR